jgi:hypothetical protein
MLQGDESLIASAHETARTLLLGNCGEGHSSDGTPWRKVLEKKEIKLIVYDADVPNHGLRRFKAVCDLPYSPAMLHAVLVNHDVRNIWDRNISSVNETVIQTEPFRAVVLNSQTNVVGPISGRDFVDIAVTLTYRDEPTHPAGPNQFIAAKGTIVSGGLGVMEDARYPVTSQRVRGYNTPGSGWVFESVINADGQESTRMHYVIRELKKNTPLPPNS